VGAKCVCEKHVAFQNFSKFSTPHKKREAKQESKIITKTTTTTKNKQTHQIKTLSSSSFLPTTKTQG
jgi:hypothetical protein